MDHQEYSYQEHLAFEKELNILRNDFYYQFIESDTITLVDFMYKPLEMLSGDAYIARCLDRHRTFYLIVDGMGKGLSASLTTMIMTTFISHLIDKMVANKSFSLQRLVEESIDFIKPILLEDEALAIDYICFDAHSQELHYAKFAMPPFLLQKEDDTLVKIRSNNPPLSKWQKDFYIDCYDVSAIKKYLFYSDGVVENFTKDGNTYAQYITSDFLNSFTREEFKVKMLNRFAQQEDDITLIFLNTLDLTKTTLQERKVFATSLEDIDNASQWYAKLWEELSENQVLAVKAGVVFTELFMNAYEHGNLGIDNAEKHKMLENDNYFETLATLEQGCDKNIYVEVYKIEKNGSIYIVTEICDDGNGFDTQILSTIFRNAQKFNGRGVFVSRKNSMGIYYNKKGNRVLFLNKI